MLSLCWRTCFKKSKTFQQSKEGAVKELQMNEAMIILL